MDGLFSIVAYPSNLHELKKERNIRELTARLTVKATPVLLSSQLLFDGKGSGRSLCEVLSCARYHLGGSVFTCFNVNLIWILL